MLSYKFSSSVFLRSPACSYESFSTSDLQEALNSPFFRLALYFASRGLYTQARLKGFDTGSMGTGMRRSLLNYYNRICFRTTPFGIFSAFSLTGWGKEPQQLTLDEEEQLHLLPDFELAENIAAGIHVDRSCDLLYSNTGLYETGGELRYLKSWKDAGQERTGAGITAIESNSLVKKILRRAKKSISRRELRQVLAQYLTCEDHDELISELESEALLINEVLPNITGESYLCRIGRLYQQEDILAFVNALGSLNRAADTRAEDLESLLKPFTGGFEQLKNPFYVNYERKVSGCIDERIQESLRAGLCALYKLQTPAVNRSLERFKANFISEFDGREIQLMVILDPEYGIGYEQQESDTENDELLRGLNFRDHAATREISWGPVQELLINKIMSCSKGETISLSDHDLEGLPGTDNGQLPPGISVMFRDLGDRLFIEEAGGACATSLIGRFTSVSEEVLDLAIKLAEDEQRANPDVIFAEIAAYSGDVHTVNINTRRHIRRYEIPLMVHSTLPADRVIPLNDLYVSVQQDEIILRSLSLNKRIVPRLSSAYNYTRSELPVFRFLCDLQYQGLRADLTLRPEKLLPGLNYCPRIEYKNCILKEAFWIVKAGDINEIADARDFMEFARQRHISRYFAISNSDRQLVFDLEDPGSINMFLEEAGKAGDLVLKEFFVPPAGNTLLKDREGRGYIHQMITTLSRTTKSYFPVSLYPSLQAGATRYFFPGDEWIYFKIYCATQYANQIIARKIYPLIRKYSSRPDFGIWFFIRYYDPEPHLRVRIQAKPALLAAMPGLVNQALKPFLKSGLIRRLQVDTYVREIERYGADAMEQAETVFMRSSELVAEYMQEERNEDDMIQFSVYSVHEILAAYQLDQDDKIGILEQICKKLMSEWDQAGELKSGLDKKYREYQHKISGFMSGESAFFTVSEKKLFEKLLRDIFLLNRHYNGTGKARVRRSVSDILHMHMNRIFSSGQRKRELLIYYFCLRFYRSCRARATVRSAAMKIAACH